MTARRFFTNKAIDDLDQLMLQAQQRASGENCKKTWQMARHMLVANGPKIRTEERVLHMEDLRKRYEFIPRQRGTPVDAQPIPIAGGSESA